MSPGCTIYTNSASVATQAFAIGGLAEAQIGAPAYAEGARVVVSCVEMGNGQNGGLVMGRLVLLLLVMMCGVPALAREYDGSFEVTSYCSCTRCCGPHARGITASGQHVAWGAVAADWDVLPAGTKIELSCYPGQVFTVLDTGSAIQGRRIDIWQHDHQTALEFGRHPHVKVWILDAREAAAHSRSSTGGMARSSPRVRTRSPASDLLAFQ